MAMFTTLKYLLYWIACWKVGKWIATYCDEKCIAKYPPLRIKHFDPQNKHMMNVSMNVLKGKSGVYFIHDATKHEGKFTKCSKEAAKAKALGKTIYVFRFDRSVGSTSMTVRNACDPLYPFNFMTEEFVNRVPDEKIYAQVFNQGQCAESWQMSEQGDPA